MNAGSSHVSKRPAAFLRQAWWHALIAAVTCGCSRDDSPVVIATSAEKEPAVRAREMLEFFFEQREIDVERDGEWLVLTKHRPMKARVAIREVEGPHGDELFSVKIDAEFVLSEQQKTVETFVDTGESETQALMGAVMKFEGSTLETMCRAHRLGKLSPEEPTVWEIGGTKREAFGNLQVDGADVGEYESIAPVIGALQDAVKASALGGGTHWVRLDVICTTQDVLYAVWLDNQEWAEGSKAVGAMEFPRFEGETYRFAYFLVIREVE